MKGKMFLSFVTIGLFVLATLFMARGGLVEFTVYVALAVVCFCTIAICKSIESLGKGE